MGVDYKQKYLKYKIKYLNAKKKFRGGVVEEEEFKIISPATNDKINDSTVKYELKKKLIEGTIKWTAKTEGDQNNRSVTLTDQPMGSYEISLPDDIKLENGVTYTLTLSGTVEGGGEGEVKVEVEGLVYKAPEAPNQREAIMNTNGDETKVTIKNNNGAENTYICNMNKKPAEGEEAAGS